MSRNWSPMGGFPFVSSWAANEGQSDLFATLSCGRILFGDDVETNAQYRNIIPSFPKDLCDSAPGQQQMSKTYVTT